MAGIEDKADLEDFKADLEEADLGDFKTKAYSSKAIHRRIRSALSIVKSAASPRTTRLKKESNLKYSTSRNISTRKSR